MSKIQHNIVFTVGSTSRNIIKINTILSYIFGMKLYFLPAIKSCISSMVY